MTESNSGWGAILAERAARRGSADNVPCEGPSGHVFVCLHCGRGVDQSARIHRFAWPASLAVTASLAAVLFVMLLADRGPQRADRAVASRAIDPVAPTSAASTPRAAPDRIATEHRGNGDQQALTSVEAGLVENFCARGNTLAFNDVTSVGRQTMVERRQSSFELIERMVCDPSAADDPLGRLFVEPTISTRSK